MIKGAMKEHISWLGYDWQPTGWFDNGVHWNGPVRCHLEGCSWAILVVKKDRNCSTVLNISVYMNNVYSLDSSSYPFNSLILKSPESTKLYSLYSLVLNDGREIFPSFRLPINGKKHFSGDYRLLVLMHSIKKFFYTERFNIWICISDVNTRSTVPLCSTVKRFPSSFWHVRLRKQYLLLISENVSSFFLYLKSKD